MKKVVSILLFLTASIQGITAQTEAILKDTTITIKVKGLTCSNDLKTIATNVQEVNGVKECKAGKFGPTSSYKITYNPSVVNRKDLVAVIENTPGCGDAEEKPYKVKNN